MPPIDMSEFHQLRHAVNVEATKMDDELGAARADNPPVDGNPHIQAAHEALGRVNERLKDLDAWGKKQEAGPAQPKPPAYPTTFENRNAFDVYLPNFQQQVLLDGNIVKAGFGPPMEWFSHSDGTIQMVREEVPEQPEPEPLPPPDPAPQGVVALEDWGAEEYGYRRRHFSAGMTYAVRFRVPSQPWKDAAPLVRAGFSYTGGSGTAAAEISTTMRAIGAGAGAGGVGQDTMNPPVPGVYYVLMRAEQSAEVQILVQTPQAGVRE